MFRDFRTGPTNSPRTSECTVIRLLIVETLRKLRICMETGGGKKIQNLHSMAKKLSIGEWIYIYILEKKGFYDDFSRV